MALDKNSAHSSEAGNQQPTASNLADLAQYSTWISGKRVHVDEAWRLYWHHRRT
jgi:hypothetical protein